MTNLTLKHLRYFEALARHGHFGRAADVCGISQPALSMQIKDLEAQIGAALFERTARQVRLTGFGDVFALRVRDILRAVDELGDLARTSLDRLSGRLRVGMIPTLAPYLLPGLLADLAQSHPELEIHVRESLTVRLIDELASGRLDTAILALPIGEPSFEEVELFREPFLLVRPLAEAERAVPSRDMLAEMRLLLLEEGHCFRDQALAVCTLKAAHPRELLEASSLSTLVQMVSAGIGVTLIPQMALAVETRSAGVSVVPFDDPQPERRIGMVWRRSSPLAGQLLELSAIVRGALAARRVAGDSAEQPVARTQAATTAAREEPSRRPLTPRRRGSPARVRSA